MRFSGLAIARRGQFLLGLLELELLLPFVYLGHRDNTGGDADEGLAGMVC
jgi:hypothetical protein